MICNDCNKTLEKLREYALDYDTEIAHDNADSAIVEFLKHLGFDEIAEAYEKVDKWYA